jgi:hypothetical protein
VPYYFKFVPKFSAYTVLPTKLQPTCTPKRQNNFKSQIRKCVHKRIFVCKNEDESLWGMRNSEDRIYETVLANRVSGLVWRRPVLMDCSAYFSESRCYSFRYMWYMSQYCDGDEKQRPTAIANLNKEQSQVNVISDSNMILINYMFKRPRIYEYRHTGHKTHSSAGICGTKRGGTRCGGGAVKHRQVFLCTQRNFGLLISRTLPTVQFPEMTQCFSNRIYLLPQVKWWRETYSRPLEKSPGPVFDKGSIMNHNCI